MISSLRLGPYESAVSMKSTPSSTARRTTATAAARSAGPPQTPSPTIRMAPKPSAVDGSQILEGDRGGFFRMLRIVVVHRNVNILSLLTIPRVPARPALGPRCGAVCSGRPVGGYAPFGFTLTIGNYALDCGMPNSLPRIVLAFVVTLGLVFLGGSPASAATSPGPGIDVSWPQCGKTLPKAAHVRDRRRQPRPGQQHEPVPGEPAGLGEDRQVSRSDGAAEGGAVRQHGQPRPAGVLVAHVEHVQRGEGHQPLRQLRRGDVQSLLLHVRVGESVGRRQAPRGQQPAVLPLVAGCRDGKHLADRQSRPTSPSWRA